MKTFLEWMEQTSPESKTWKASKKEILTHWSQVPPGLPLTSIRTVPSSHKGSTITFDGLRITGSSQWIDFILSRLRDMLGYEGEQTRLQVIYKQQIDSKTQMGRPNSYVFYLQVKQRGDTEKSPNPVFTTPLNQV
jgi:hypothetical protein